MINLMRADSYAAARSWGLRIGLALSVVLVVAYLVSSHAMAAGTIEATANSAASMASDLISSSILVSLAAAIVVGQSFDSKAIHDSVLMVKRWQIVIAKIGAYLVVGSVMLAPWVIGSMVAFIAGWELRPPLRTTYSAFAANITGADVSTSSVLLGFGLLLLGTLNYLAIYSICVLVAFVVRRQVVVVVVGVLVGFFGNFGAAQLGKVSALRWLAEASPYHPQHMLRTLDSTGAEIAGTLATSIGFLVLVGLVGAVLFRRADIK